jgi:hypothetical protein
MDKRARRSSAWLRRGMTLVWSKESGMADAQVAGVLPGMAGGIKARACASGEVPLQPA